MYRRDKVATKASLSQAPGSGLQVIRVQGDTPRTLLFISSTHRFLLCLFHFSSFNPPLQCLWCQTGVSTGQGNCLFFLSLSFCLSEDKTTWPQALCSLAYREKCQERSCVRACMCVSVFLQTSRKSGKKKKKERKVNPSLRVMQEDKRTQQRLTCTQRLQRKCLTLLWRPESTPFYSKRFIGRDQNVSEPLQWVTECLITYVACWHISFRS